MRDTKNTTETRTEGSTTMADTKATAAATTMKDGDLRTAWTRAMEDRDAAWMIQNGTGIQDPKMAMLDERAHILGDELRKRYNG